MSKKKILISVIFLIGILFSINIFIGIEKINPKNLFSLNEIQKTILFKIRVPENLSALIIGLSLGLSGAIMQTILNNPLASPFTLGISASAGFGASLFLLLGFSLFFVSLGAIFFSIIAIAFVYFLSKKHSMTTNSMVLSGIAIKFFFDAMLSLVQYRASEESLSSIMFWLFGNIGRTNYKNILVIVIFLILSFIVIYKDIWSYTAIKFGEERAISLGVDVKRLKAKSFIIISTLSALVVSFSGTIGFIGICAPHIARKLIGEDQRYYLVLSSLIGSLLLIISSIISKIIKPGVIIPIGIVTSLVGLPMLFFIIIGGKFDRS